MTDAEFWGVMAETIEGARSMPENLITDGQCSGLCIVVASAKRAGIVGYYQSLRLLRQIDMWMHERKMYIFAFPPGLWRPRVRMCRDLMKMAMEEK